MDAKYLYHWLTGNTDYLQSLGNGATFKELSKTTVERIKVPAPPLDEQRRIAAILDQGARIASVREAQLGRLDSLAQSLFVHLFGQPVAWARTQPMGTIGDMAVSFDYGTSEKSRESGSVPVLRMGNISYEGRLELDKLKYTELSGAAYERFTVKRGDLLFNRTNSPDLVGKTTVVNVDMPMAYAGYLIRVRMKPGHRAEFLSGYLNSRHGKAVLRGLAKTAVSQANINARELRSIRIAIPSREAQDAYVSRLKKIQRHRAILFRVRNQDRLLVASLTQRAFSGQL